jgi:hypothetical protein
MAGISMAGMAWQAEYIAMTVGNDGATLSHPRPLALAALAVRVLLNGVLLHVTAAEGVVPHPARAEHTQGQPARAPPRPRPRRRTQAPSQGGAVAEAAAEAAATDRCSGRRKKSSSEARSLPSRSSTGAHLSRRP